MVSHEKHDLVKTAPVSGRGRMCGGAVQAHFRNQLVNEDDNTNGADETAQERSAEDRIQKAKSAETGYQDKSASETSDHARHASVLLAGLVWMVAGIDSLAYHLSRQERSSGFRSDDHLWASSKERVN